MRPQPCTSGGPHRYVARFSSLGILVALGLLVIGAGTAVAVSASPAGTHGVDQATVAHNSSTTLGAGTECGDNANMTTITGTAKYHYIPSAVSSDYDGKYHAAIGTTIRVYMAGNQSATKLGAATPARDGSFTVCTSLPDNSTVQLFTTFSANGSWGRVSNMTAHDGGRPYTNQTPTRWYHTSNSSIELGTDVTGDNQPEVTLTGRNQSIYHLSHNFAEAHRFVESRTGFDRFPTHVTYPAAAGSLYFPGEPLSENEVILISDNPRQSKGRRTVYHEYGHALMWSLYKSDGEPIPDGGRDVPDQLGECHSSRSESTKGFAMKEGWAVYISSFSMYVNDNAIPYNRTPALCGSSDADGTMDGYRVEGAIAATLYDITDDTPTEDGLNKSFGFVWETFDEEKPQNAFEMYDAFAERIDNTTALDEIFTTQGIDVVEPTISVDGGPEPTVVGDGGTVSGTVADTHANVSTVEVRRDSGDWTTIATGNVTSWSVTASANTTLAIRATDPWNNTATRSITVTNASGPMLGDTGPVRDLDGDGTYLDINGDGETGLFDALTYYNNRNSQTVAEYPSVFDYDGDGQSGTLFDTLALYNQIKAA